MIAFNHYSKVYQHVCILYSGGSPEYAIQLDYALPFIREAYPDLKISLYVPDHYLHLTKNSSPQSRLNRNKFAYTKEIKVNPSTHTVLDFLHDCRVRFPRCNIENTNGLCLICPSAIPPATPLSDHYVSLLESRKDSMVVGRFPLQSPEIIKQASLVIGAENEYLFFAAANNIKTILVAEKPGKDVYQMLFPHGEVWSPNVPPKI